MGDRTDEKQVRTRSAAGSEHTRTPDEALALQRVGEAPLGAIDLATEAAEAGGERRRAAFDTAGDAALTFAEGVVDALSLGLIHETGAAADLRREINSGSALLGELTGTMLGLGLPGPVNLVTKGGRAAGRAAAQSVLGEAKVGSRAAIGVRGAEGAGEMAALMGAASIGHQVTDAVLDDKPFSATAVVHEAGLGALLGGGVSLLSGMFSRAAKRYEVQGQGGLLDPASSQSRGVADHVDSAISKWNEAIGVHEQRLGVLKQLEAEGALDNVVPEFMAAREVALARAKGFAKDLGELDWAAAMAGDEKAMARYIQAQENVEIALGELDDLMSARMLERMRPQAPGRPLRDPGPPVTEQVGISTDDVAQMDRLMADPARAAEYEALYGRPYRPQARREELAGGQPSPTSELKTPAEVAKGTPRDAQATPEALQAPAPTGAPAARPQPGARFDMAEWTPARVQGEMGAGRVIAPTPEAMEQPFASVVQDAAARAQAFGDRKAFISSVYEQMPAATRGSLDDFKRQLLEAHQRGELVLERADMVAAMDPALVSASELRTGAADFHFVTRAPAHPNNILSNAYPQHQKDHLLLPDGYFGSVADKNQNAAAFSAFRQRMAVDTPMDALRIPPGRVGEAPVVPAEPVTPALGPTPVLGKGRVGTAKAPTSQGMTEGQAAVRRYVDEWFATADMVGPRHSPGDYAAQEVSRLADEIRGTALGRDTAAATTDLAQKLGLPRARTKLGAQLLDLYTMRKVAEAVTEASKGTVMRGATRNSTVDWIVSRAVQRSAALAGRRMVGGVAGAALGGPLGYFAGYAMAGQYLGFAGRAAGAAGRLYQRTLKAADSLLKGRRATYVAAALAPNKPIAYSEAGPIKDPVQRIEELRRVAASPQSMADFVVRAAGDLNLVSPEFVAAAVQVVQAQLTFLNEMAPPMRYDALGRPMRPSAGALRRFLEAENAVFNLEGTLHALETGQVTKVQVEALRRAHTPVYSKIAAFLLDDPEKLARLERAKLNTIQMVVGAGLTPAADPEFIMRQQMAWPPPQEPGQTLAGPTQALNIPGAPKGSGHNPRGPAEARPTPSQSYGSTGRAPGN